MEYEWPANRGITEEVEEGQLVCIYSALIDQEFCTSDEDDEAKVQGPVYTKETLPIALGEGYLVAHNWGPGLVVFVVWLASEGS